MRFDKFTIKAQEAIQQCQNTAENYQHQEIDAEHLLVALIIQTDGIVIPILQKLCANPKSILDSLEQELKAQFRPEFLNRIDDTIIFHSLSREHIKKIIDIQIELLKKRLFEKKLSIVLADKAKEFLIKEGFDPVYGARPLKKAIQKKILQRRDYF